MDRWVIVGIDADGTLRVYGPKRNHTYRSSEAAGKDADAIEPDFEEVFILPIRGIEE
jgi:hypothetical protein